MDKFRRKIGLLIGAILIADLAFGGETRPAAGKFDFSAIDRLWKIVSVLENDREPMADDWEALVRTPGYAALIAHERGYGIDFLKRNLRLVFKPSLAGGLEKADKSSALRHFLELKAKKAALLEFQARLQNPKVAAEALDLLRPWLPDKSIESRTAPSAAFVIFDRDARGGYGPLIFDLLYAFDQGDDFKYLFGHESFHYYRRELAAYDPGDVRQTYEDILQTLSSIQDEGMADQIDKPNELFSGGPRSDSDYAREYKKNMADSPRILGALDRLLCRLEESPSEADRISGEMFSAVPQSGHPTGYFMARAILDGGGKAELIRTFNNLFAFFYLYNAAASRNPALPRLSNGAVTALRNLEKRIMPAPETDLARAAFARGIDLSAIELFRKITALLAKDQEPEPSLWDGFFNNPGYHVYFSHNADNRNSLRDAMSLAFKPSREAELKQALEKRGSNTLSYLLNHKKNLEDVAAACEQFKNDRIFEKALEQVQPFLPSKAAEALEDASMAVIYLGFIDSRFGYETMLADPLEIRSSLDSMPHYVRLYFLWRFKNKVRPYNQEMLTRRQAAFLDAWEDIQHRGLGDLITRRLGEKTNPEYLKRYELRSKDVPRLLGEMARIMERAADDPAAWRDFEALANDFFVENGCPVGYFMAATILDVLGREALAETSGHSPAFVRAYRKAALQKGGLPAFSDKAVDYLGRLESEAMTRPPSM